MTRATLSALGQVAYLARRAGIGRLELRIRDLTDSVLSRMNRPLLKAKLDGIEIHGYLRHRSFLAGIVNGQYERYTLRLYEELLKPGMTVIDGGAHIGLYSLLASRQIGPEGKVFAFEPDPHNFKALLFNLRKNECDNVIPVNKAISNEVGGTAFNVDAGTISSSLFNRKDMKSCQVAIEATTIDNELAGYNTDAILIKLDIEGAEPLALEGMRDVLKATSSAVAIVEVNPEALSYGGFTPEYLVNGLNRIGFQVMYVDESDGRLVPVAEKVRIQKGNLYCISGG